jgi:hypothetical protein
MIYNKMKCVKEMYDGTKFFCEVWKNNVKDFVKQKSEDKAAVCACIWRKLSSGIWCRVVVVRTTVSEERITSIFREGESQREYSELVAATGRESRAPSIYRRGGG